MRQNNIKGRVIYHRDYQPMILQVDTHKQEFAALIHNRILPRIWDLDGEFVIEETPKNEYRMKCLFKWEMSENSVLLLVPYLIDERISAQLSFIKPNFNSNWFSTWQLANIHTTKTTTSYRLFEVVRSCFDLSVGKNSCWTPAMHVHFRF